MGRPPFLRGPLPRIFAHRGLARDVPENTLSAFRLGLEAGATHLETDVHATADGIAVLSHDPDLRRLAGRAERIDQLTIAELEQVELPGGERFATLRRALDELPDARFNIDIKSEGAVRPVVDTVRAAGALDRVLIVSFDDRRRARAVRDLPGVATAASVSGMRLVVIGAKLGLRRLVRRGLAGVDAVQAPERYGAITVITPRVVDAIHAEHREVHVWTVNDPADMRRLIRLGVDGLITDRCDLAAGVVAELP